ncbi:hypothetical protein PLANTIT3_60528 [Plantibacter sp. T3]|nr:hypothetical protein PLANTIT3_60528 [Plantibacter sp. T3]
MYEKDSIRSDAIPPPLPNPPALMR